MGKTAVICKSKSLESALSFGMFFVAALAVTVILTPIFNAARGSILIPALYHWQLNRCIRC